MNDGPERTPDLRDFLDRLPQKPCSSKLPEEYCKICRRLNGEVASFCQTKKKPEKPKEQPSQAEIPFERPEFKASEKEEPLAPKGQKGMPILTRPTYKDGETSLEFVLSQRIIDQARKSLPRFIPVQRGPRTFKPLEEETAFELEPFPGGKPSLFRSPTSLGDEEEDMLFSLATEDAIEVVPIEILNERQIASETVFSSADGVVEVVEIVEEQPFITFEEEVSAFKFMPQEDTEIIEAEIVEAEVVEEPPLETPEVVEDEIEKEPESQQFEFRPTEGEFDGQKPGIEPAPELRFEPAAKKPEEEIPKEPEKGFMKRLKLKKKKKRMEKAPEPAPEPVSAPQEPSFDLDKELESIFKIPEEGESVGEKKGETTGDLIPEPGEPATSLEPSASEAPTDESAANLYMCPSCGAFVSSTATACLQCGYNFETEEEAQTAKEPESAEPEEKQKTQDEELAFEPMTMDSHEDEIPFDEEELMEITKSQEIENEPQADIPFEDEVKEDSEEDLALNSQEAPEEEIEPEMDVPFSVAAADDGVEIKVHPQKAPLDETELETETPFEETEEEKEGFEFETESTEGPSEESEPEMHVSFEDAIKEGEEEIEPERDIAPPEDIEGGPSEMPELAELEPAEEKALKEQPEMEFTPFEEEEEAPAELPMEEEKASKKLKKVKLKKKKKLKLKKVKKGESEDEAE